MEQLELVIKQRGNDWHVCIKGREGVWAAGRNLREALGDLVYFHQDVFGIKEIEVIGNLMEQK